MEQNIQQINQKPTLPIKTKIVAWIMAIIGSIGLMTSLFIISSIMIGESEVTVRALYMALCFSIPAGIGFFVPGILILLRKKIGWVFAVAVFLLLISLILFSQMYDFIHTMNDCKTGAYDKDYLLDYKAKVCSIKSYLIYKWFFLFMCVIFLIPLILLLLDRKNFWKVAS